MPAANRLSAESTGAKRRVKHPARIPTVGAVAAAVLAVFLLLGDIFGLISSRTHDCIEAASLIAIGLSFCSLCFTVCRGEDRFHWRLMMGLTFCLWGVTVVLPASFGRTILSDVDVLLFIMDLVLIILERSGQASFVRPQRKGSR